MELPKNCANCALFDDDCHCTLSTANERFTGAIKVPTEVVCAAHEEKHEPKREDEQ